ncbi:uncharacterized protein KY384_002874 [Bacidia gigantensis]|uniref:uncharacterized protein n=1 Tax=Bacidia gigantensis TaxID=2732470 RepID=UPI001D054E16|nr:uncharacterized protein KY384_002874 [Bacidia gigantensis]KAG8532389.1 hypothetical protein KY384_002874 [Bacidia gigantensis]
MFSQYQIFEQSSFANEIGAAIHLCPNASRVLLRWGLDAEKARFDVTQSGLTARANSLDPIYEADYHKIKTKYSAPWYLSHRVDLHNTLKDLATKDLGKGPAGTIRLRSKVVEIDPDSATVTLADGTSHNADIIIAADGVHSRAVSKVIGHENPAAPTGFSAFRFLIPTEELLANEKTKHFLDGKEGQFKIFVGEGGDDWCTTLVEQWNISAKTSDVLEEFRSFHSDLVATMSKATDVKLWKLLYREPIPTWHRKRLLLIGDAAHPMLPHQGQAGAQAIEDGAAIGVLLSGLQVPPSPPPSADLLRFDLNTEIERKLEAFETVRRKRASLMQIFSNAGQDEAEKVREEAGNQAEFHEFNFGHDVLGESERVLGAL